MFAQELKKDRTASRTRDLRCLPPHYPLQGDDLGLAFMDQVSPLDVVVQSIASSLPA
jgi:hypothetical protein